MGATKKLKVKEGREPLSNEKRTGAIGGETGRKNPI